jgi:hypothetical protein
MKNRQSIIPAIAGSTGRGRENAGIDAYVQEGIIIEGGQ